MLRFFGLMTVREHEGVVRKHKEDMHNLASAFVGISEGREVVVQDCMLHEFIEYFSKVVEIFRKLRKNDHRDPKTGRFVKAGDQ